VGGAVGGAAVGATFGAAALAFIPVLGAIMLVSGVVAGAAAGQAVESHGRALAYPELISVPMVCPVKITTLRRARFGLEVRGLSKAQAREAGLGERSAMLVTDVAGSGPAAVAGLRNGDLILSAAGQDLEDAAELEERLLALAPGALMALRVWRDGQVLELVATAPVAQ
jgi:S1-C subfamily serine protease